MALFNNIPDAVISCGNSSCHGPNPNDNVNGLQKGGNNPGVILAAIKMNVTQMMFLTGLLNPFQLDDISAYLAPQPDLSGTALDFGPQAAGTASPALSVTLRSIGGVNLVITAINVSGSDAADFVVGGGCAAGASLVSTTIAQAGGNCDVSVFFQPSAAGPRSAVVSLSYAGASTFPGTQTIALTGVGAVAAVPVAAIDPGAIDFGEVVQTMSSVKRTITITNPGNAPLQISGMDLTGLQAGEFHLSGSCLEGALPILVLANGSCTVVVEFTPFGTGLRATALKITHNAAGSPGLVVLTGLGVAATCPPPAPPAEFQTLACPAGQSGSITQSRSYVCAGTAWTPGAWVTTAQNCQSNFPGANLNLTEFFNTGLVHYFMTADAAESLDVETGGAGPGWSQTLVLGHVWDAESASGIMPVCRFYGNPAVGADGRRLGPNSHFYTVDPEECAAVRQDPGWVFEGIVFHAVVPNAGTCPAPLVPVYRSYNGRFLQNDSNHRYATDTAIVLQMQAAGWKSEGVVLCIAAE